MVSRSNAPTNSGPQLPVPARIGRYEVIDRIATGGMAEIFIAVERTGLGLERLVVVKRILPHLAVHASFIDMFLAEARYVARIAHPNVVQIYELSEENGTPFLSMEYVAGGSLRDVLVASIEADVPTPVGAGIAMIAQACAGAHAAHDLKDAQGRALGLVHRDISPHNLMVTSEGHVKLLDFGIAKATEASGFQDNTRTGALKGKVHYMAPEQCKQEPLDRRADIFALGIVGWELLAQERLFKRDSELDAMQAIVNGDLRDLRTIRPDVPVAVVDALERALRPRRDARYATADDMRRALLDAATSAGIKTGDDVAAAFVRPLLGARTAARTAAFLQAAHERVRLDAPPHDVARAADADDATLVDKPGQARRDDPFALVHGGGDEDGAATLAGIKRSIDGAPVSPTADTRYSPRTSTKLPAPRRRKRDRIVAVAVALLTCAVVTVGLLALLGRRHVEGAPLVIAFPPTVDPAGLRQDLLVLDDILERLTHRPVEFHITSTYEAAVDELLAGRAAFAVLPPYLFVTAREQAPRITPLATKLIDGSAGSDAVMLVVEQSPVQAVADLKGRTFCFTDRKSSSGFILPRRALRAAGLDPDRDIVTHFSGNHTQVLRDLNAGVCEAGATYSGGYLAADRAGVPVSRTRTLAVTGRSPQDIVVAAPGTPPADVELLRRTLLTMKPIELIGKETIGALERISGFVEPRMADYDALAAAAAQDQQ